MLFCYSTGVSAAAVCAAWYKGETGRPVLTKARFEETDTNANLRCNNRHYGEAGKVSQHTHLRDQDGWLDRLLAGQNRPKKQRENRCSIFSDQGTGLDKISFLQYI